MESAVHSRLPPELDEAFTDRVEQLGVSRSEACRRALRVWLWFEDQRGESRRVVSLKDGETERELMWP